MIQPRPVNTSYLQGSYSLSFCLSIFQFFRNPTVVNWFNAFLSDSPFLPHNESSDFSGHNIHPALPISVTYIEGWKENLLNEVH